jgi:uncharacterized protein (TIGR00255 family)
MKSMTGYGRRVWENGLIHVEAEVRCVNGRYFSLSSKLPQELASHESEIKQMIGQKISRGSVFLTVSYKDDTLPDSEVNEVLLSHYYQRLKSVAEKLNTLPPTFDALLHLPGVVDTLLKPCLNEQKWQQVCEVIRGALHDMEAMREREGNKLGEEICGYWQEIQTNIETVAKQAPTIVASYRDRLKKRLRELAQEESFHYTDEDILREVALFTDRVDISEEISRSTSHLKQIRELLAQDEPLGKTLEFLLQEIVREANTITAKANDAECSRCVVAIKTLVEKIREQSQNVE